MNVLLYFYSIHKSVPKNFTNSKEIISTCMDFSFIHLVGNDSISFAIHVSSLDSGNESAVSLRVII